LNRIIAYAGLDSVGAVAQGVKTGRSVEAGGARGVRRRGGRGGGSGTGGARAEGGREAATVPRAKEVGSCEGQGVEAGGGGKTEGPGGKGTVGVAAITPKDVKQLRDVLSVHLNRARGM
jgi:hypothetical protein